MSENLQGMTDTQPKTVQSGMRGMSYPDLQNSLKGEDSKNDTLRSGGVPLGNYSRGPSDGVGTLVPPASVTGPLPASHPTVIKRAELAIEHVGELMLHEISEFDHIIVRQVHDLLTKLKIIRDKPQA